MQLNLHTFLTVSFLLSGFIACGGDSSKEDDTETTRRSGGVGNNMDQAQYDGNADLSADGEKAVFLSGRTGVLRSYKLALGSTASSAELVLGEADLQTLTSENEVALSGSGNLIGIIGSEEAGSVDVYVADFTDAGNSRLTRITEDERIEEILDFSTDSRLLSYLSTSASDLAAEVRVVYFDDSGAIAIPASSLGTDGYIHKSFAIVFEDTASQTYIVSILETSLTDFTSRLIRKTLDLSGASLSVTATEVLKDDVSVDESFGLYGGEGLLFYGKVAENNVELVYANESLSTENKSLTLKSDESLQAYQVSLGSQSEVTPQENAVSLGAISATSTNGILMSLATRAFNCTGSPNYARHIALYSDISTTEPEMLWLETNVSEGAFGLKISDNPCGSLNRSIVGVSLAADSTADNIKALFEAQNGDNQDVFFYEKNAEGESIRNLME